MQRTIHLSTDQALAREYHGRRVLLAAELLLPEAHDGGRWAALNMLTICSDAIADGCPIDGAVGQWLAAALRRLAGGDGVEEALSIPHRSRGRRKEREAQAERGRRFQIAYRVEVERHRGSAQLAAIAAVADDLGMPEDTVLSAWRDHKRAAKREIQLRLKWLGEESEISSP